MARVHLFTPSSSNERRRHSPEHNIAEEPSAPTLPEDITTSEHENKTISVSSQPTLEEQQQPNLDIDTSSPALSHTFMTAPSSPEQKGDNDNLTDQLTASSAALTAALLQNAHGNNDMVGAVAAALSVKPETLQMLKENNNTKNEQSSSQNTESLDSQKPEDSLDQAAVAATALQLLGLSHPENKEKQNQPSTSTEDNNDSSNRSTSNLLVASYPTIPGQVDDIDLTSDDMMQDYKRGSWTREEDELLLAGIKKYGYGRWKEIATAIPGRKGKQLKQRWDNTLAAKYVDQEWIRNKIRTEEALQQRESSTSSSSNDDKTLKFLETTDWNDIAIKITEKAREGDQHAIEALLSQALLGTVASHAAAAAAAAAAGNSSQQTNATATTASTSNSTTASPHNTTIHHPHDSTPSTPTATNQTSEAMNLNFSRSTLDSNNPPPLNYADAAALALYASHLSQQTNSSSGDSSATNTLNLSNHPYFLPFGGTGSDTNAVAAAAAAAVAAVAQQQAHNKDNSDNTNNVNQANYSRSGSPSLTTTSRATSGGQKRRRSDPALAETQSAAMTIYASSTPITTTINNQTQTVYPCLFPSCGKTFARLYNLKSHSRTHTDDRPFVCQACDAAFSRNHDLKRHSKIHGGAKPYKCEGCKKSFSRLDALKRHKSNQRNKQSCTQQE